MELLKEQIVLSGLIEEDGETRYPRENEKVKITCYGKLTKPEEKKKDTRYWMTLEEYRRNERLKVIYEDDEWDSHKKNTAKFVEIVKEHDLISTLMIPYLKDIKNISYHDFISLVWDMMWLIQSGPEFLLPEYRFRLSEQKKRSAIEKFIDDFPCLERLEYFEYMKKWINEHKELSEKIFTNGKDNLTIKKINANFNIYLKQFNKKIVRIINDTHNNNSDTYSMVNTE